MQLNHLNLCVDDPTEARMLFERSFGFQTVEQRGREIVLMTDGQGFTLILTDMKAFGGETPHYPEGFHVGFIVESHEQVDQAYGNLVGAGIDVNTPKSVHGSYGFYFTALGGILFEVSGPLQNAPV